MHRIHGSMRGSKGGGGGLGVGSDPLPRPAWKIKFSEFTNDYLLVIFICLISTMKRANQNKFKKNETFTHAVH